MWTCGGLFPIYKVRRGQEVRGPVARRRSGGGCSQWWSVATTPWPSLSGGGELSNCCWTRVRQLWQQQAELHHLCHTVKLGWAFRHVFVPCFVKNYSKFSCYLLSLMLIEHWVKLLSSKKKKSQSFTAKRHHSILHLWTWLYRRPVLFSLCLLH